MKELKQLRCPCCKHRLGDIASKDYVVALKCRHCNKPVVFTEKEKKDDQDHRE